MNRRCMNCGKKMKECMGFVLARDIINFDINKPCIRELCERCSWALSEQKCIEVD